MQNANREGAGVPAIGIGEQNLQTATEDDDEEHDHHGSDDDSSMQRKRANEAAAKAAVELEINDAFESFADEVEGDESTALLSRDGITGALLQLFSKYVHPVVIDRCLAELDMYPHPQSNLENHEGSLGVGDSYSSALTLSYEQFHMLYNSVELTLDKLAYEEDLRRQQEKMRIVQGYTDTDTDARIVQGYSYTDTDTDAQGQGQGQGQYGDGGGLRGYDGEERGYDGEEEYQDQDQESDANGLISISRVQTGPGRLEKSVRVRMDAELGPGSGPGAPNGMNDHMDIDIGNNGLLGLDQYTGSAWSEMDGSHVHEGSGEHKSPSGPNSGPNSLERMSKTAPGKAQNEQQNWYDDDEGDGDNRNNNNNNNNNNVVGGQRQRQTEGLPSSKSTTSIPNPLGVAQGSAVQAARNKRSPRA